MKPASFRNSLSGRLLLLGVLPAMLAIGLIVALSAFDTYRDLAAAEKRMLDAYAIGAAAELSVRNERWNNVAALMATAQTSGMFGKREETLGYTRAALVASRGIIGTYVNYEPDADGLDAASAQSGKFPEGTLGPTGRFLPYWYTDTESTGEDRGIKLKRNNDMELLEYYQGPKTSVAKTGAASPTLTEPYEYEGVLMVSHTYPIVMDGKFMGIAGLDRGLDRLGDIARSIKKRCGADVFILSPAGRFVAVSTDDQSDAAGENLRMKEVSGTAFATIGRRWLSRVAGDVFEAEDPVEQELCFYASEPVEVGGWTVVVRKPRSVVMQSADAAVIRNVSLGAVLMLVGGGTMLLMSRSISRRVRLAAEAADRIARGDLTQPIAESTSPDETGQLMRSMSSMDGNLNSLVGNVKQAGIRLNSTATEIAATSKQQEASSATFGAASNQIAAAVKEISATGRDLVKTMESVNRMAAETADLAGAGQAGLQGMELVMRDLDGATASIAGKLNAISERSQKITTVITTITKVADQTNILSINAAIEAEKAGEFGAGFLVIAREIRRLADQTASATLDIEQMVQQMQGAVSSGVMEMDRFSDQVRRGVREVASAGAQLTEIIDRVNRSTDSFKQVNESMQAQSEGAQQISDAMSSLVGNANQTMQSVQEFSRAASDLQSAIGLLREAVAQFKLRS